MQGKTINGFELIRLLGVGGMAEVWYAENEIQKPAAVKILKSDLTHNASIVERFRNEAKVMVCLDHPNIRQVYGYGIIDGRPAIVMEYLDGDDLKARMKRGQRFTEEELRKWWNQIVDALNYTHEREVVHRDIKPSNIFVDKKGDIKLLDYGIAKVRESISMTQTGAMMGTLIYMSPEQVDDSKHIGPKSDIYSLAVTFVHLLTGMAPYDITNSSDFKIRESIVYKPLDMTDVPADWQGFLMPFLEKDPEKRSELRHFGLSSAEKEMKGLLTPVVPKEETIIDETSRLVPQSNSQELKSPASYNPQNRKYLWIAIAVVAIVVALLVLVLKPKDANLEASGNACGYEYVDLGLPSGTMWAMCNIGATNPEDYGDYFAWGETKPKDCYDWKNYKFANGDRDKLTKYCDNTKYGDNGYTDSLSTLQSCDDPSSLWGSGWYTPTKIQWEELLQNTTFQWTTQNGVKGMLFTAKNGRMLFLPAAGEIFGDFLPAAGEFASDLSIVGSEGRYWSSSLDYLPNDANYLAFQSGWCGVFQNTQFVMGVREVGMSVRPVWNLTCLEEDEAFANCTSIDACKDYLKKYPQGHYVTEVQKKKTELENNVPKNGTYNGYDYVDLGLPSGTLWATCNVGASKQEEYGNYFAWGESKTKTTYEEMTYKYWKYNAWEITKYCSRSDYGNNGYTDTLTILQAEDDPSNAWGNGWHTPTKAQWDELLQNTAKLWTTQKEVNGMLFTADNGQTIFLPAAGQRWSRVLNSVGSKGFYWSSSLSIDHPCNAWQLSFSSEGCEITYHDSRYHGFFIRPVHEK